jgi:hypothetical protein
MDVALPVMSHVRQMWTYEKGKVVDVNTAVAILGVIHHLRAKMWEEGREVGRFRIGIWVSEVHAV